MRLAASACNCQAATPIGPTLAQGCGGAAIYAFMTVLETFLRFQCDIEDPCGRATQRFVQLPLEEYDFIVIGGGSAGAVAASRLSEMENWKVLLIEAGEDEPVGSQVPSMFNFFGSAIDWQYFTQPEKGACLKDDGVCYWPRGKVLGGSSVLNGMMYIRGNPQDYDNWAALGNTGWSFQDVLPFFMKSENNLQIDQVDGDYHATGGLLPVTQFNYHPPMSYAILKAAEELGYKIQDLNGRNNTGFMIAQTTSKNGVRYSTAHAFLRPAARRSNLHILLNSTAAKVIIDPATKTARGVEVIDNKTGNRRKVMVKKEVIVSGGAINSPQILMLSGVGPKHVLERVNVSVIHELPGVGRNLHNHVSFAVNFWLNSTDKNPLNWNVLREYLQERGGLMSGTGLSDVTGKIVSPFADQSEVPDTQYYVRGFLAHCAQTGHYSELSSARNQSIQIIPNVLHPKSKGQLVLASKEATDKPLIYANYLSDDRDIRVLINGIKVAIQLSKTSALRPFGIELDRTPVQGCEKFTFGSNKYWECAIRQNTSPENHQAGSCKMGPKDDTQAVVDNELRVHGIKGLRVMDTSIMPEVTSGNTNAPAIMIAEKGVHMIKQAWQSLWV